MKIDTLQPKSGSVKKAKRIARGVGSGHGKTATKGHKGQNARAGSGKGPGFEGGQTPMQRRLPKRGFKNFAFKKVYTIVNLDDIQNLVSQNTLNNEAITPEILIKNRIVKKMQDGIKVLGEGSINTPVHIKAHAFSASAVQKIESVGGKAEKI